MRIREIKAKVSLDALEKWNYYFPAVAMAGILLVLNWITWLLSEEYPFYFASAIVTVVVGYAIYLYHNDRYYVCVETDRTPSQNYDIILSAMIANGWTISDRREGELLVAHSQAGPWRGRLGEMITVRFNNDQVWLNSIHDPSSPLYTYVTSSSHRRNVGYLKRALQ